MALRSTNYVKEINTICICWGRGKGGRCVRLTTLPPLIANCLEILAASTS